MNPHVRFRLGVDVANWIECLSHAACNEILMHGPTPRRIFRRPFIYTEQITNKRPKDAVGRFEVHGANSADSAAQYP
jgi:hypothetical protein